MQHFCNILRIIKVGDKMRGRIYIHVNKINGKVYVGQTTQRVVTDRFGKNGKNYKSSPKFWEAIKKYGWDAFETIVLPEVYTDHKALDDAEVYYIKLYDSCFNGYNTIIGKNLSQKVERKVKPMSDEEYYHRVMTALIT